MKQLLLLLSGLLIGLLSYGQYWDFEKPDYEKIEQRIKKKDSDFFYPKLMERYNQADTSMTLEERRHLYYGYIFQPRYSPYGNNDFFDSLNTILSKEQHSEFELNKIIEYTDSLLLENPFDLRAINYQLYALEQKLELNKFEMKINQMGIVFDAVMSSGDGTSKENAFYVIYISHEYDILNILGFQFAGSQSLIEHYDYLTVAENEAQIEGLYFDVSPCLKSSSLTLEKE